MSQVGQVRCQERVLPVKLRCRCLSRQVSVYGVRLAGGPCKGGKTGSLSLKDIWTPEKDAETAAWAVEQVMDALATGARAKATPHLRLLNPRT